VSYSLARLYPSQTKAQSPPCGYSQVLIRIWVVVTWGLTQLDPQLHCMAGNSLRLEKNWCLCNWTPEILDKKSVELGGVALFSKRPLNVAEYVNLDFTQPLRDHQQRSP